jgi:hypothetical protein
MAGKKTDNLSGGGDLCRHSQKKKKNAAALKDFLEFERVPDLKIENWLSDMEAGSINDSISLSYSG